MSDNLGNGNLEGGQDQGAEDPGVESQGGQIPGGAPHGNGAGRRARANQAWQDSRQTRSRIAQGGRQAGVRVAQQGRQAGVKVAQGVRSSQAWQDGRERSAKVAQSVRSGQAWQDGRQRSAKVAQSVRSGQAWQDGRQRGARVAQGVRSGQIWHDGRQAGAKARTRLTQGVQTFRGSSTWGAVDQYFEDRLIGPDETLAAATSASAAAGLPAIAVSATQGKLLHLLARTAGARAILEIGTLGGYSTIWLARALPTDGHLISLEINPAYANLARANLEQAGLASVTEVRVGPATDTLDTLEREGHPPFDFVFIDADRSNGAHYFQAAVPLCRPGAVIVVDNVVRDGQVANGTTADPDVQGVRQLLDVVGSDERVSATAVQTVGSKGYDGFLVAVVGDPAGAAPSAAAAAGAGDAATAGNGAAPFASAPPPAPPAPPAAGSEWAPPETPADPAAGPAGEAPGQSPLQSP